MKNNFECLMCVHCGAEISTASPVSRIGEKVTYRCENCGQERVIFALSPPSDPEVHNIEREVIGRVRWNSELSPRQVVALRKMVPEFAQEPIQELSRKLERMGHYDISSLYESEARKLAEALGESGMILEIRSCDKL